MTTTDDHVFPDSLLERPSRSADETALVVVDMVNWNVPRTAGETGLASQYYVDRLRTTVIPNNHRLVAAARAAGVHVVFLRVGCARPDHTDGTPAMKDLFDEYGAHDGAPACEVIDELTPQPGDLSLLKTGSGGFTTSDLDRHLRDRTVRQVYYTGVVTNGCVMATALAGFDLGYAGLLVTDATGTLTADLQAQAENLIGSVYATATTTDDALATISAMATRSHTTRSLA